jgi:predicted DNA-binding WGR domain protein
MAKKARYELVEGSSSKFWEIELAGKAFTTTYGRIGTDGQSTTKTFADPAAAKKEHDKLVAEKTRKGYAPASGGGGGSKKTASKKVPARKKTPAVKKAPAAKKATLPVVWKFKTDSTAFGIFVDASRAWVSNQKGDVFAVSHAGEAQESFKLPLGAKCLIGDDAWRYAGADDGSVYDLTGRIPRLVYKVKGEAQILWLDIYRGNVCVSDDEGGLTVVDAEDNVRWSKKTKGGSGWMVRADASGIYHGHDDGVTKYDWDGKRVWHKKDDAGVWFGWQEADAVYAGTTGDQVLAIDKAKGKLLRAYPVPGGVPACAATTEGDMVFGNAGETVFCYALDGTLRWQLPTGCGVPLSMQYFDGKLYVVTGSGYLASIDVSAEAIARALEGERTKAEERKAPKVKAVATNTLETTTDSTKGVVVECVKEGAKLRVRVISSGYDGTWFCQFPKDIREPGAKYVVDEVREATQGGFYRVLGDIKRLS